MLIFLLYLSESKTTFVLSNRQLFLHHIAQTSPAPIGLELERAADIHLYDKDGKSYIDLISGFAVSNIGHSNPKVIAAIKTQIDKYMHLMVYGEIVQQPQVVYAQKLTQNLPTQLDCVYFTNSGAEATEGAMKLAKRITGRTRIAYFKESYHGSTQGALSIMGDEYYKQAFRPLLPDTTSLTYNDLNDLSKITEDVAAVFIEPIQSESGVSVPSTDFMQALATRCKSVSALLVADEAQTGFGRTGKLWGFENFGIVPDILLLAKAIGGGLPLGAFISSYENMQQLTINPVLGHITTFGGHPVSCAAGLAAFEVLLENKLIDTVEEKGKLFETRLKHSAIKAFHRKGLMMAIQFGTPELNQKIVHSAVANGLITDWFLFAPDYLRICPPLIITDEEIERVCDILLAVIDNHQRK